MWVFTRLTAGKEVNRVLQPGGSVEIIEDGMFTATLCLVSYSD